MARLIQRYTLCFEEERGKTFVYNVYMIPTSAGATLVHSLPPATEHIRPGFAPLHTPHGRPCHTSPTAPACERTARTGEATLLIVDSNG